MQRRRDGAGARRTPRGGTILPRRAVRRTLTREPGSIYGSPRRNTADTWYPSWAADVACTRPGPTDRSATSLLVNGRNAITGHATSLATRARSRSHRCRHVSRSRPLRRPPPAASRSQRVWYCGTCCLMDSTATPPSDWWDILGPFVGFRYSNFEDLDRHALRRPLLV
jgi:hypothetical protein